MGQALSPEQRQRLKAQVQQLRDNSVFQVMRLQVDQLLVTKRKELRGAALSLQPDKMLLTEGIIIGLETMEKVLSGEQFKAERPEEKENPSYK